VGSDTAQFEVSFLQWPLDFARFIVVQ